MHKCWRIAPPSPPLLSRVELWGGDNTGLESLCGLFLRHCFVLLAMEQLHWSCRGQSALLKGTSAVVAETEERTAHYEFHRLNIQGKYFDRNNLLWLLLLAAAAGCCCCFWKWFMNRNHWSKCHTTLITMRYCTTFGCLSIAWSRRCCINNS